MKKGSCYPRQKKAVRSYAAASGSTLTDDLLFPLRHKPISLGFVAGICEIQQEKSSRTEWCKSFFGAATQIRTGDLILTKDALYLLSYSSKLYAPYERGIFGDREGT